MAYNRPGQVTAGTAIAESWGDAVDDSIVYLHANMPIRATMWHHEAQVENGNAIAINVQAAQAFNCIPFQSASADGDIFTQSFVMEAGTYTFKVLGATGTDCPIIDWTLDGAAMVSSQDWYAGAGANNVIKSNGSITVTGNGRHLLRGTVNGKNASSSNYNLYLTKYWFEPADDTQGV